MSAEEPFTVAKPRVAAGALFQDQSGRVLLVKPIYKPLWDIPGGYVEPGESPRQACEREIAEELGLDRTVGELLVADWAPVDGEGDKLLFVFDGGLLTDDDIDRITLQTAEMERFDFFDQSRFTEVFTDRLRRRIQAAMGAAVAGRTAYLEPVAAG